MKLTLPIPPSVNALYANLPGKGRVRTKIYKSWVKQADNYLLMQARKVKRFVGPCEIIIRVARSCRADTSNIIKITEDWLVKRGITGDDKHNHKVTAEKADVDECEVEIIGTEVGRF